MFPKLLLFLRSIFSGTCCSHFKCYYLDVWRSFVRELSIMITAHGNKPRGAFFPCNAKGQIVVTAQVFSHSSPVRHICILTLLMCAALQLTPMHRWTSTHTQLRMTPCGSVRAASQRYYASCVVHMVAGCNFSELCVVSCAQIVYLM